MDLPGMRLAPRPKLILIGLHLENAVAKLGDGARLPRDDVFEPNVISARGDFELQLDVGEGNQVERRTALKGGNGGDQHPR